MLLSSLRALSSSRVASPLSSRSATLCAGTGSAARESHERWDRDGNGDGPLGAYLPELGREARGGVEERGEVVLELRLAVGEHLGAARVQRFGHPGWLRRRRSYILVMDVLCVVERWRVSQAVRASICMGGGGGGATVGADDATHASVQYSCTQIHQTIARRPGRDRRCRRTMAVCYVITK